jgi:hypothetical protein
MKLAEIHLETIFIEEPKLEFGHQQTTVNPKDGLWLYGPYKKAKVCKEIRIGVVGTANGISYFRDYAEKMLGRIEMEPPSKTDKKFRLHLANFPGIKEAFDICYQTSDFVACALDEKLIDEKTRIVNLHEAVQSAAMLYVDAVVKHERNDERAVDVWILVLPECIFERCKPLARRSGLPLVKGAFRKGQKAKSSLPLFADVIDQSDEEIFGEVPDFHRQIKAKFLSIGRTTQLLRETTLAPNEFQNQAGFPTRRMQDASTVAWNVATGLYYKTQPFPPWKISDVRPGVCYVGLVYKAIPNHVAHHVCCAAQMFMNEGDGFVFRGANGPWKTSEFEYHLGASEATALMNEVLNTYFELYGSSPKEIFIHGRTSFNDTEWQAFLLAIPDETNLVGVRIKQTTGDTKLFRDGDYPVLRGTAILLGLKDAYLWTSGYLPQLDTYIGPETPNPLHVSILRSKNEFPRIQTVLRDILGLTKINYNSCNFNDSMPVTVSFADKVGEVLVMQSAQNVERQPFKFYV